jgi:cell wall-associated NlpC family hydrolase
MQPYFHPADRIENLDTIARSWEGTPFFAFAATRGPQGGVDCVRLAQEIMVEAGAVAREPLPEYTMDYARHTPRSALLRWLLASPSLAGRMELVPPTGKLRPGDVLALKSGRADHHLAIMIKWGQVVHAVEDVGAITHDAADPRFTSRVVYAFRIFERAAP